MIKNVIFSQGDKCLFPCIEKVTHTSNQRMEFMSHHVHEVAKIIPFKMRAYDHDMIKEISEWKKDDIFTRDISYEFVFICSSIYILK